MPKRIFIDFISAYLGRASYRVTIDGESHRIEHQFAVPEYRAQDWNITAEQFKNEHADMLGTVRGYCGDPVPAEVVEAFNDYRRDEHLKFLAWLDARPQNRPFATPEQLEPPAPVVSARWDSTLKRMVRDDEVQRAAA